MALYRVPEGLEHLTVQDFKSVSDKYEGLAKSARYTVFFKLGRSIMSQLGYQTLANDLAYLCESTELPGRGFMQIDNIRYYGPSFKLPFQTSYEDITFTLLCRNKSVERQMFDDWMEIINPTNTFDFRYRDQYACEIDIFTYGEVPGPTGTAPKSEYCFTLRNAWPVLINPQPVTWADDNVQRLGVTFTYEKWVRVGRDIASGTYSLVKGKDSDI